MAAAKVPGQRSLSFGFLTELAVPFHLSKPAAKAIPPWRRLRCGRLSGLLNMCCAEPPQQQIIEQAVRTRRVAVLKRLPHRANCIRLQQINQIDGTA